VRFRGEWAHNRADRQIMWRSGFRAFSLHDFGYSIAMPPAPSTGARAFESGLCLVSGLMGLDDQIQFVGAVDLPKHAVILARRENVGFAEVMQPVNTARRVISQDQHGTGAVFGPREQKQMIGAEVEH
jgi:hypothetical protein